MVRALRRKFDAEIDSYLNYGNTLSPEDEIAYKKVILYSDSLYAKRTAADLFPASN